jgi:anthranilate synthase component 1
MTTEPLVQPIIQPIELERAALLALHAAYPERYPALLESAASGRPLGRYDILFAFPRASLTLSGSGLHANGLDALESTAFLHELDRWWRRERSPSSNVLPFTGGWLLYLGYELANQIEPKLMLPAPASGPIAQALRIPAAIVFEHETKQAFLVVERGHEALIEQFATDIASCKQRAQREGALIVGEVAEDPPQQYLNAIARALEHIAAGDIYQANLSRGWRTQLASGVRPSDVYLRLRQTNPAPFSAIAQFGELSIVSSSPERLVQVRDGGVATRPIAGTRPRGADRDADEQLVRELRAHPKERAEHIMLIDLERNDLGRICEAGTVEVNEYMTVESYAHVHHIVSNVRGRLRTGVAPGQVLSAVFPGGTITGCPKIRCMELIAELEGQPRGAYTGSLGYLNLDGSMDMNILIRTIEIRAGQLTFRAGGGIVADSVPLRELEEARAKARGLVRALSQDGQP